MANQTKEKGFEIALAYKCQIGYLLFNEPQTHTDGHRHFPLLTVTEKKGLPYPCI